MSPRFPGTSPARGSARDCSGEVHVAPLPCRGCRRAPGPGPGPRQRGRRLSPGRELLDNVGPWPLGLRARQAACWGGSPLQPGLDALGLPGKVADPALPMIVWEMVLCTSVALELVPSQWCRMFHPPANCTHAVLQ